MMSKSSDAIAPGTPGASFVRQQAAVLAARLAEERRFIQAISGARQVGKTTLVTQVLARLDLPSVFVTADEPMARDAAWLEAHWERARRLSIGAGDDAERTGDATASADPAREPVHPGAVLVLDEVQKLPGWSETVKRLWDEDTRSRCPLKVVLLGSAPMLVQRGLTESLAGRFERIHLPHWSFREMRDAFGFSLEQYILFGGYPGAAPLAVDFDRWRRYLLDSLIETTIARDVLLMTRVDKPALLRQLLLLGCRYSGQVLSYTKMLGQLHDAANTTTLAHYLDLLDGAGMLTGLSKFSGQLARQRASSPKLQVFNTALMSAIAGLDPKTARADAAHWGHLVESTIGAHLVNAAAEGACSVHYWLDRGREVDFVVTTPTARLAIEVKSGRAIRGLPGLGAFTDAFGPTRLLVVGGDGMPVEEFLLTPVVELLRA